MLPVVFNLQPHYNVISIPKGLVLIQFYAVDYYSYDHIILALVYDSPTIISTHEICKFNNNRIVIV